MNNFGPIEKRLNWEVELPSITVNFLDLTITIQEDGTITTKMFQKKMNLHLYRTPESCQPESILRSFIYGAIHRYYWQNTFELDFISIVEFLFIRIIDRGHQQQQLLPAFKKAIKKVLTSQLPNPTLQPIPTNDTDTPNKNLYIHLPHHPNNPFTDKLRIIANNLKEEITKQTNLDVERIIIAYSKAPNIGDMCKRQQMEYYTNTNYKD